MNKQIKIFVADDHPIFRHGLCMLIKAEKTFILVGEADNGQIALDLIKENVPDIVILDLDMPIMDGVAAARIIQTRFPEIKTVILTMHKDRELLNMMKSLNIKGYILKDSAVIEIVDCINKVVSGKTFISPAITEMLLDEISKDSFSESKSALISILTPAEKRILKLIADTKTNREIAEKLYVSVRTIENHRFNICNKLNIKGNHSLVKFALSNKESILALDAK
ncbi:MAG: response regulator transcription factor [Acidobacteriota bacterium]